MAYKMKKTLHGMLGLNEKHSTPDIPVKEENLGQTWGYADMDRSITINSKLNDKQKAIAVEHEKEHVLQMRQGRAWFDGNNVYHKPKKDSPIQAYKRVGNKMIVKGNAMDIGDPKNPVEKEVYSKTGKHATKI